MLNNAAVFELFEIVYTYKINGKIIENLFGTKNITINIKSGRFLIFSHIRKRLHRYILKEKH